MAGKQVRERKTYLRWHGFVEFLEKKPSLADIIYHVHSMINDLRGYRSMQASRWSKESLEQVLADLCAECERNNLESQIVPDCTTCWLRGKEANNA